MPPPISLAAFKDAILYGDLTGLTRTFLQAKVVHALPTEPSYEAFVAKVKAHVPGAELVSIVGSGNWRYSLNPDKLLNEYLRLTLFYGYERSAHAASFC
jgi:hypothetical protein